MLLPIKRNKRAKAQKQETAKRRLLAHVEEVVQEQCEDGACSSELVINKPAKIVTSGAYKSPLLQCQLMQHTSQCSTAVPTCADTPACNRTTSFTYESEVLKEHTYSSTMPQEPLVKLEDNEFIIKTDYEEYDPIELSPSIFKIKDELDYEEVETPINSVPISPKSQLANDILTQVPNPFNNNQILILETTASNPVNILNKVPPKNINNMNQSSEKPLVKIVDINKLKTLPNLATKSNIIAPNDVINHIMTINNGATNSSILTQNQSIPSILILNDSNLSTLNENQSNSSILTQNQSISSILIQNDSNLSTLNENQSNSSILTQHKSIPSILILNDSNLSTLNENQSNSSILKSNKPLPKSKVIFPLTREKSLRIAARKNRAKSTKSILENTIKPNILITDKKDVTDPQQALGNYAKDKCPKTHRNKNVPVAFESEENVLLNSEFDIKLGAYKRVKPIKLYKKVKESNKLLESNLQDVEDVEDYYIIDDIGVVDPTELPDYINQNEYKTPKVCIICGQVKTPLVICSPAILNMIRYLFGSGFSQMYSKRDPRLVLRACGSCLNQVHDYEKMKQSIIKIHSNLNGPDGHTYNIDWASRNDCENIEEDTQQLNVVNEDIDVIKPQEDEKHTNIQPPFPHKEYYNSDDMKQYALLLKFECSLCNTKFISEERLNEHHFEVHARLKCDMCDFVGTTSDEFTKHKNDAHNALNIRGSCICKCGHEVLVDKLRGCCEPEHVHTNFTNSEYRKVHSLINYFLNHRIRAHSGRYYKCKKCDKRIDLLIAAADHMLISTGEKPYECNICRIRFSRSSMLAKHKCPKQLLVTKKRQQGGADAKQPKPKKAKKYINTESCEPNDNYKELLLNEPQFSELDSIDDKYFIVF